MQKGHKAVWPVSLLSGFSFTMLDCFLVSNRKCKNSAWFSQTLFCLATVWIKWVGTYWKCSTTKSLAPQMAFIRLETREASPMVYTWPLLSSYWKGTPFS